MRQIDGKKCNKCGSTKDFSSFHKHCNAKDGLYSVCKQCRKLKAQLPEERIKTRIRMSRYMELNKVKRQEYGKAYLQSFDGQFRAYKGNAKKRNKIFELTKEDCKLFFNVNCYYCGEHFNKMGIDRVDTSKGYFLKNCVPCCSYCNKMKWDKTVGEFFSKCVKIIKHNNLI